ncbi:MAG: Gfo/Idh/MocA family oxidoreductase [bacterium]|nr:Gfo/Idh/MocA family oxidoreductase [bacterium]
MKSYRVGFAGLVHDHVWGEMEHWKALGKAELIAAADPNRPLLEKARENGVSRTYDSWEEMLEREELDIVEVATDNASAVKVVEAAAPRGIHIKIEKPMAARLEQANRMVAAVKKAGVQLMIHWPTAFQAQHPLMFKMIRRGDIGQPYYFRLRCAHAGPKEIGCSNYFYEWLYDEQKNGAGALMDYCCYGADMCSYLFGLPERVVGIRAVLAKDYPLPDDNAMILMKYDKVFGVAEACWTEVATPLQPNPICLGSEGNIGVMNKQVIIQKKNGDVETIPPPVLPEGERNGPEYLVSCLETGREVEGQCSAKVSRDAQEILEAGLLSADRGEAVDLPITM